MAYVTPSTVTAGTSPITAAAQNIIVNDILDHETRIVTLSTPLTGSNTAGNQVTAPSSFTDVLNVTIVAVGKPVLITWGIRCQEGGSGSTRTATAQLYKDGVAVGVSTGAITVFTANNSALLTGSYIDPTPSGSTTYAIYLTSSAASTVLYTNRWINACSIK